MSSPDYLTCGDCAREFLLENITLFIAHKAWDCPKKARFRREHGPSDIGEDTSSPLTCSMCSRVFLTARGLLQHVQSEHGMSICVRRGPLIISDKRLRSPGPHSPGLEDKQYRCSPAQAKSPSLLVEKSPRNAHEAHPADFYVGPDRHVWSRSEASSVERGEGQDKQEEEEVHSRGDNDLGREVCDNEPKDLSQRSRSSSAALRDCNRFKPGERPDITRCSPKQTQAGLQIMDSGSTGQDRPRSPASSSIPKKRRFTQPDLDQGREVRTLTQGELSAALSKVSYSAGSTGATERPVEREGYAHGDTVGRAGGAGGDQDCERHNNAVGADEEDAIDFGQYRSEERKSPICLVVGNVQDQQDTATSAEHDKNIILKKLLQRNGTQDHGGDHATSEVHTSSQSLLVMPKLEIDTANMVGNPFDNHYSEAQAPQFSARAQSASVSSSPSSSSSSYRQQQQQSYLRAPYTRFLNEPSIEQSIDQIIRASVGKELDDVDVSNDSLEPSPPLRPPSSPSRYSGGPHMLPGATTSYQAIPLTMPSLIASRQLGAVAGYFSPQPYTAVGSRRGPVATMPYPNLTGSTATSAGGMSAPEETLDIVTSAYEAGGLYPVVHDGGTVPRLALGYHHKASMDGLRRGASDYKAPYGPGAASLYRGDVDIRQWAAMAGDTYVGPMAGRIPPEQQGSEGQGISPDLDDPKTLVDARMKKRRYPTSRPFKCAHCDQAFNQRIHLKKHMSKHTGVKPFKCQQCDYSTVERSHLKVHYRIHTGEKPYRCPFCDYATAQNSTLKIHLKRHHEGQQLVDRDSSAAGSGRRDSHKVSTERMRGDSEFSDPGKMREHFEGGQDSGHLGNHVRYGQGYSALKTDGLPRRLSTGQGEQAPPGLEAQFSHTSANPNPKQELRDVDADGTDRFHTYMKRQVSCTLPPASPSAMADNTGARMSTEDVPPPSMGAAPARRFVTPEKLVHERRSASARSELMDGHQGGQLKHPHHPGKSSSSAGESVYTQEVYLERNVSGRRTGEDVETDDPAPLNFSSTDDRWGGQKQIAEGGNDLAAKQAPETSQTSEQVLNKCEQRSGMKQESVEMSQRTGVGKIPQEEAATAGASKPDEYENDYSDDEDDHLNVEAVKLAVIPDKAFVRG